MNQNKFDDARGNTMSALQANPMKPIYRTDYEPPNFLIKEVQLSFELAPERTIVQSRMYVYQNPQHRKLRRKLVLQGDDLELLDIQINGVTLKQKQYEVSGGELILKSVPETFQLFTKCAINPSKNTELMGLYLSNGIFCTQCEAEGFRRITYFLDRPDVLSRFTTTIIANKKDYPVLLSNGNCVEQKDLADGLHLATWQDPYPKPSYLFALVAGPLEYVEDEYVTIEKRQVSLKIFVEQNDKEKAAYALYALKAAMQWDEQIYGRGYDLNTYMIVAIHDFNMGAMENKGLNVFNAKYVLADTKTATDLDYENILSVVGHEYFHNWTGNRVTCRDWFQLSLKEGLTIFRDQSFSADILASVLTRIDDVRALRSAQFPEDAGPMAHPVRPESYIEINNFYTATVYNKGAEVIRMLQILLGHKGFRAGMDLYFSRHDGQAVTIEDFIKAMEDANQFDCAQFRRWYYQAGTPQLTAQFDYNHQKQLLTLKLKQSCAPTPGQTKKAPFVIPIKMAIYDQQGASLPIQLQENQAQFIPAQSVLVFTETEQTFTFIKLPTRPVVSLLQGFSAPVKLQANYQDEDLIFLIKNDCDEFNRFEAWTMLVMRYILKFIDENKEKGSFTVPEFLLAVWSSHLQDSETEKGLLSVLLNLPEENLIAEEMPLIDITAIHHTRKHMRYLFAQRNREKILQCYEQLKCGPFQFNAQHAAMRRLKNTCLQYLLLLVQDEPEITNIAYQQFQQADNMSDRISALSGLANLQHPLRDLALQEFYDKWCDDPLVMDKWFSIQACADVPDALQRVKKLMEHTNFVISNPNRVRSLLVSFSKLNLIHFHATNGQGYQLLGEVIAKLDSLNAHLSARLAEPFTQWRRYSEPHAELMKNELLKLQVLPNISRDLYEIVNKSLAK